MFGKSKEKKNNDNELESYGVWVKHGTSEEAAPDTEDSLDLNTELDLPDFDDTAFADSDFSDMFKDDNPTEEESAIDFDTTLSADELANITDDSEITTEEIDLDTTFSEDEITVEESAIEEPFAEETAVDEINTEDTEAPAFEESSEPAVDDFDIEETSLDDFNFDELSTSEASETENKETPEESNDIIEESFDIFSENAEETESSEEAVTKDSTEEENSLNSFEDSSEDFNIFEADTQTDTATETEEVTFGEDEEISLDDFMDEGFSDESVAAGNNGFEPGKGPDAANATEEVSFGGSDEEISLDDFIDAGEFETTPDIPVVQEETVVDEPPLEMDISFDDSADTVETEDNVAVEASFDDDQYDDEEEDTEIATEEVNLDSFTSTSSSEASDFETEDIDLSDFGIDSSAEETPITQDVEESKMKDTVVDYDLSVENDNTAAAPVVNVIANTTEDVSEAEEISEETPAVEKAAPDSNTTSISNSLLEQIVADLSGLKNEINQLKVNLAEIKEHENVVAATPAPESEPEDIFTSDTVEDQGGFFASDDTDDTIALSADELNNIMNTTSVVEETVEPVITEEQEPVVEETSVNIEEEPAIEDSIDLPAEDSVITEDTTTDEIEISEDDTLAFNFEDEKLQEPDMNDISIDESDFTEEGDLPSEITIEKSDDILVESDTNDFMDSVADSTQETVIEEPVIDEVAAEPVIEDSIFDEANDEIAIEETVEETVIEDSVEETVSEPVIDEPEVSEEEPVIEETPVEAEPENTVFEESIEDDSDFAFDTVDSIMRDEVSEETGFIPEESVEEKSEVSEEPVITEPEEEPVIEETMVQEPVAETVSEPDFSELDQSNNDLTDSNIDYLTAKNDETIDEEPVNSDLKQDIKSVLLYMDQLLENLPEDKIIEFAKSDEFTTYKKLFSELGLS